MAASGQFPGRLYWINDSGDKGRFYFGPENGKNLQSVKVADFKPRDTEALALTDCPEGRCLAFGDIGDNSRKRKNISITFVKEAREFKDPAPVLRTLTLEYPDGPHDAEAMAFLPDGTLWFITKEIDLARFETRAAAVFSLSKAEWHAGGKHTLRKVAELPLPKWLADDLFFMRAPTDLAINSAREVLGILTYGRVVEIPLKYLSEVGKAENWTRGREYEIVTVKALAQQESLSYAAAPDRLLWSTEYRAPEAPIFSMTCAQAAP